ncbi:MAG TPA: cytochrome c oxidase subunit 3 [Candidatus Eisenbacteria bacterium]|nr:cytochrome c oxidase subunit 3 [Candidatus Eisenbacteria bacterium]
MGTFVQDPPAIPKPREDKLGPPAFTDGGGRDAVPAEGSLHSVQDYSPPPASTAIWVVIAAVTMTFAALTSALIVRQGASLDWHHLVMPRLIYANTLVLLVSSVTLEISRRKFKAFSAPTVREFRRAEFWLKLTLALGVLFVVGQWFVWMQLRAEGLYLATNPNSSFFYVLTVAHALHIFGGLCGLVYVVRRLNRGLLHKSTMDAASRFWHFVDVLWIYLMVLLWIKI